MQKCKAARFTCLFYQIQYLHKRSAFVFVLDSSSSRRRNVGPLFDTEEQKCLSALWHLRAEIGWPVTYLTRLTHMPASFMTSLIETTGHKNGSSHGRVFGTFKRRLSTAGFQRTSAPSGLGMWGSPIQQPLADWVCGFPNTTAPSRLSMWGSPMQQPLADWVYGVPQYNSP